MGKKIGTIIVIIGIFLGFGVALFAIGTAGLNYLTCPDCEGTKETFFKTVAYEFSAPDYEIEQAMQKLRTETDPEMISALRTNIAKEAGMLILFWIGIASASVFIFAKKSTFDLGDRLICYLVIPFLTLITIQVLGSYYALGIPRLPFVGMWDLSTNLLSVYFKPKAESLILSNSSV